MGQRWRAYNYHAKNCKQKNASPTQMQLGLSTPNIKRRFGAIPGPNWHWPGSTTGNKIASIARKLESWKSAKNALRQAYSKAGVSLF